MCFRIYALVLFSTIDLCIVEGKHSVVLHREKRRWISGTFQLREEDPGPFPKDAVKVFNDKSQNHTVTFSLQGQGVDAEPEKGLFSIDRYTGQISTNRKVDREKTKQFLFQVDARDMETLQILDDHMLYRILVIDINDNAPEFSQKIYKFDVRENEHPGEEIFRVEATDPDDVRRGNGKVSYSIVSQSPSIPSNIFKINSENGSILLQKCLDYDAIKTYSLVIKARDNGLNILSSSTEAQINVINSNTNHPIFTEQSGSLNIDEGDNDRVILRVSVTDKDTPHTPAWKATYKIIKGNEAGNYRIETDPETNDGILFLIKPLDYELARVKRIEITVENEEPFFTCQERNGPTSEGLSKFILDINVKDKNDAPVFFPPVLTVQEVEGQKPGKILGRFNATDTDEFFKHSIRYVKASDPADWISIDSDTGVISTVKTLDRESPYVNDSVYICTVYAIEDGEIPTTGTGTMHLTLVDVNDNLPYLLKSSQEMCDDGDIQSIIIAAQDDDLDPFGGPFTFELVDNEQHVKDNWKLTKATGNTARLARKNNIPIGNYTVPLKIRDRQGITQETSLNLHICHCLDGKTCPAPKPARAVLAGAAIGLLFAGLLLLLLGFCLFIFCTCAQKAQYSLPSNEPLWTMVNYNEEGGNADSQTTPFYYQPPFIPNGTGLAPGSVFLNNPDLHRQEENLSAVDGQFRRSHISGSSGLNAWGSSKHPENLSAVDGQFRRSHFSGSSGLNAWGSSKHPGSWHYGGGILRPINMLQGRDAQVWANRRYLELSANDVQVNDEPRVYIYEEDEMRVPSLDAISIVEDSTTFDYLNDVGPRFATLARICQKQNPL
ncbi:cadherin-like protein 26 isoform X2 [Scyliorhinus canicula]|nr:cadherin-like protein 26 isoform X2 [Scyliorhinus canicula]XP_038659103.1 cadherin-like protein 26 isoform X2 [Scyliorhinus canicula]